MLQKQLKPQKFSNETLVLFLFLSLPIADTARGFLREVVDRGVLISDSSQRLYYASSANTSSVVSIIEIIFQFGLISILGFRRVNGHQTNDKVPNKIRALFIIMFASLSVNFSDWQWQRAAQVLAFLLAMLVVRDSDLSRLNFNWILRIYKFIFAFSLFYTLILRDESFGVCRTSKCSVLGKLNNSYFIHENGYAIFLLIYISLLLGIQKKQKIPTLALPIMTLFTTGSRTGIVALFAVCFYFLLRKLNIFATLIKLFVLLSFLLFMFSSAKLFSGRGEIYGFIRSQWREWAIIGKGMNFVTDQFWNGASLSFLPYHEHGMVPTLLARFGVIATIIFSALIVGSNYGPERDWIKPAMVAIACSGVAEASLYPSFQNPNAWVLIFVLISSSHRSSVVSIKE